MEEDKNCELLFNYLKSILYDTKVQKIDLEDLDEPFVKLGMGLQYLESAIEEMKTCSAALSKGNLSDFHPSRENFLCDNLKNIHANLEHLTWQAKQVAKGDYSQQVSYLGEFSVAFNTMIQQLKDREKSLKAEAIREKEHSESIQKYNRLFMEMIQRSNDDFLVTDLEQKEFLYSSHNHSENAQQEEVIQQFKKKKAEINQEEMDWEMKDSKNNYLHIFSFLTEWNQIKAYVHFIHDVTLEKQEQAKLRKEAYFDSLTQIGNRYYFAEKMEKLLAAGHECSICYCDLDQLKYVNDTFGHAQGDLYLQEFVQCIRNHIRNYDIFARLGGDEFCIVLENCSLNFANEKMQAIQENFEQLEDYLHCFSYGVIHLEKGHGKVDLDELLAEADYIMYQQKREHRKNRE